MGYMTQNLIKRGHTWYVRYIVPADLQTYVGKREIVRSLKTRDLDEARKRRHAVLAEIVTECHAKRDPNVTRHELAAIKDHDPELHQLLTLDVIEGVADAEGDEAAHNYAEVIHGDSQLVSFASEKWLERLKGRVTVGTIDGRRHAVSTFTKALGDMALSRITPNIAFRWLEEHLIPSGRSPKTLGRYISAMNLLWDFSKNRGWCNEPSPFSSLSKELPKVKRRKRGFQNDELKKFRDGLKARSNKHPDEYDVGVLLIESTCRLNEIAELRVRDVHPDGEVHVSDGQNKSADRVIFVVSTRALEILKRRVAGKGPDDQLFEELKPGGQDKKLGHALSKRMLRTLAVVLPDAKENGLDIHSIRRWGATVLDNLEGFDRDLKNRAMGHKTGDLLGDVYSDGPGKRRLRKLFEAFSREVERRL